MENVCTDTDGRSCKRYMNAIHFYPVVCDGWHVMGLLTAGLHCDVGGKMMIYR